MRKLALILLVFLCGCTYQGVDYKSEYLKVIASVETIKSQQKQIELHILTMHDSIVVLHDSIAILKARPLMTEEQFIDIYKYESLRKYWDLCMRNPVQWKYFKGWCARIFEQ